MRILAILRQVYEQKSIQWNYEKDTFEYKKPVINGADLSALQWASDYAKQNAASMDAFILMTESTEESIRRTLNKYQLETCIQIPRSKDEMADARFLSSCIEPGMYDLIVCGDETEDEHTTSLLPLLGYSLGLEVLTSVHQIETNGPNQLLAHRKEERGATQIFNIKLPVALSLSSHISKTRYSRSQRKEIEILTKERALETAGSSKRMGAPEPNIILGKVPQEENPLERLLNVMGFSDEKGDELSQQIQGLSEEHLHFTAERLLKWLKE